MMLMSLLLAAVTFNPAMVQRPAFANEGTIYAKTITPDKSCKAGDICASAKFNRNGCFFNNFWNGSTGGTPLTIDVTQTGPQGSVVYIYWVNTTNKTLTITGQAVAKYYCVI
jgi:hypothetical protein